MTSPPRLVRDVSAERVVLCGVLKAADLNFPVLAEKGLGADAFGEWRHQLVWRAALDLWNAGRDVGPYTVWFRLAAQDALADVGSGSCPWLGAAGWLAELWDEDPTGAWAAEAADRVLYAAARRAAIRRAMRLIRDAIDGAGSREEFEAALATA